MDIEVIDNGKNYKVKNEPSSVLDGVGTVFFHNNKVFRGINSSAISSVRSILDSPALEEFFNAGLIQTKEANIRSSNFPYILEHRKIPIKITPLDWIAPMIRDAGIMMLNLHEILYENKFGLKDGHSWNIMFDFTKPYFVDFGSINSLDTLPNTGRYKPLHFPHEWCGEFLRFLKKLEKKSENINYKDLIKIKENTWENPIDTFTKLREYLKTAKFKFEGTEWTGYGNRHLSEKDPKVASVKTFLTSIEGKTVMDIGTNKGRFALLANDLGFDVIATDIDEYSLSKLYELAKDEDRNIATVLLDFVKLQRYIKRVPEITERLKCDISLFLAVIHHLCLKLDIPFSLIASRLSGFTKKHCIVEFIDANDKHVGGWHKHAWYTRENFISEMQKEGFDLEALLPSGLDTRKILLFKRRS